MVSDGKPGHYNQTLGAIKALQQKYDVQLTTIETKLRFGFLRPLLKITCNSTNPIIQHFFRLLTRLCYHQFQPPIKPQTMVISCGGQTLYLNIYLARHFNASNFFLGSLRGVKPENFSAIISGLYIDGVKNLIELELSPGLFNKTEALTAGRELRERLPNPSQKLWALLIGGDGAGYKYQDDDIAKLKQFLLESAAKYGIQWLLTTSRRTAIEHERQLHEFSLQHPDIFAYTVFFHHSPEKVVASFLGAADAVFATEDSSSMLSEAMIAGKPLFTLRPDLCAVNDNYQRFLSKHQQKRRMHPLTLDTASQQIERYNWNSFEQLNVSVEEQLAEKIDAILSPDG